MSFTVSDRDLGVVLTLLGQLSGKEDNLSPEILPGNSKIAFYDAGMVNTPGVADKVVSALGSQHPDYAGDDFGCGYFHFRVSAHDLGEALGVMRKGFGVEPEEVHF